MSIKDYVRNFENAVLLGLSSNNPSKANRVTMARAAAAVMWADGECLDSEVAAIKALISELGGLPADQCAGILQTEQGFTPELETDLKALPNAYAHSVLKLCYRIADADGEVHPNELAIIEKVAGAVLPETEWADVEAWIGAYASLLKATKKLFS
jgi:tellurite resistance protein